MKLALRFIVKVNVRPVKKYATDEKHRVWRKVHISTHEIVAAELSLSNVTDAEVLPELLKRHVVKSMST